MVSIIACAGLVIASTAGSTPTQAGEPAFEKAEASDQTSLQGLADYGAEVGAIIRDAAALMTEMIDLSDQYLLGFTEPETFARERATIGAAHQGLSARVAVLSARAVAVRDPAPGPYAERAAELKRYVGKFSADMAKMETSLARLPAFVESGDAEGFDVARADLFHFSSNAIRAENALLTTNQLSMTIGHPEYHLTEAIKHGNLVVADFLDLGLSANAGERDGLQAVASGIAAYHKGITISLDAAEALNDKLEATLLVQRPDLKAEITAFAEAYRKALPVERQIARTLADYASIAKKIADGQEFSDFTSRLDKVDAKFQPLNAKRQAAMAVKQKAAIALAAAAGS